MEDKVFKILGETRVNELRAKSVEELKEVIVTAERQKSEAKKELAENEEYKLLKEKLKDVSSSVRDLNKELNAVVKASIALLEERGA